MQVDDPRCLQSTSPNKNDTTGPTVDGRSHDVQGSGTWALWGEDVSQKSTSEQTSWDVLHRGIFEAGVAFGGQVANRLSNQIAQQVGDSHSKAASTWIGIPCAAAQEAKIMGKSLHRHIWVSSRRCDWTAGPAWDVSTHDPESDAIERAGRTLYQLWYLAVWVMRGEVKYVRRHARQHENSSKVCPISDKQDSSQRRCKDLTRVRMVG